MKTPKKLLSIIAVILLLIQSSSVISFAAGTADLPSYTFTDDLGRIVTVNTPARTAVLLASFAKVWQLSGGNVIAAPHDAWDELHLNLPDDAVNIGSVNRINMEMLLSSEPDFIIAGTSYKQPLEWQEMMDSLGIPVAYFEINDFSDYLRMLDICTDITGKKDCYERFGTDIQKQIDETILLSKQRTESTGNATVLYLSASASFVKAKNSDNVLGAILKNLGCINIADSETMLLENLSFEHILTCDPDYVFIVQRGDDTEGMNELLRTQLNENPLWNSLSAVKNNRVFILDKELYGLKPNEKWGEAYMILEQILENV